MPATLKGLTKSVLRSTGVLHPVRRWARTRLPKKVPFHTLSPDLLVALVRAFDHQKQLEGRAYYEFGLYQGFSIWFAEQIGRGRVGEDFLFHGFDSFSGLPPTEIDKEYFVEGEFAVDYDKVIGNLKLFNADFDRIRLHKGFYSKELFARLEATERFLPAAVAVIDVDMYESCVDVLDFLRQHIVSGTILIFDDYNYMDRSDDHGERRATREFMTATGMELENLFEIGRECAAFEVTRAPR